MNQQINEFFRFKCHKGLKKLELDNNKIYVDRLEYELGVIESMGFQSYFLIVQDVLAWARANGIPTGPGRGSCAGSLVAYCLGITKIDPIKYDLLFERFLNPNRIAMPDIDMDFADSGREKVLEYINNKYGKDHVSSLATYGQLKCRAAIKAVARGLGAGYEMGDKLSKLTPEPVDGKPPSLQKCYESVPELYEWHKDNGGGTVEGLILNWADKVEDRIDHSGVHACFPYHAKLLTSNGYKSIGSLFDQTIEIITSTGPKLAHISYAGKKKIGTLNWSNSKYSSIKNSIELTSDHRVWANEWTEANQSIGMQAFYKHPAHNKLDILSGWAWNDGHHTSNYNGNYVCFNKTRDIDAIEYFKDCLGARSPSRQDRFRTPNNIVDYISNNFGDGFKTNNSVKKCPIFKSLFQALGWLRGMFSANATVQRGCIRLKLTSEKLCSFIREQLMELDIQCSQLSKSFPKAIIKNRVVNSKPAFQFEISPNSTWKFMNLIGFVQAYKINKCKPLYFQSFKIHEENYETYDFSVLSANEEDQNGYVDGLHVHNSGYIIGDVPLNEIIPLQVDKFGNICSQWDMNEVEKAGLIKFDFLGLTALNVIATCIQLIKQRHGIELDISTIDHEDNKVFKRLQAGDAAGIFQIETSSGMKDLMIKMRPENISDLGALTAIFRPGPLASKGLEKWLKVRRGMESPDYLVPELKPILSTTDGFLIYQEQCMKMAVDLAGYTLPESDDLRKAIGKKLPEEMAKHENKFQSGMVKKGFSKEVALTLWNDIKAFAAYGFNKSHAIAYGLLAYQTAYLKTHFTIEFMCSLLSCKSNNEDQVIKYIFNCKELGIKVLPPDINKSDKSFSIDDTGAIRFGLAAVKNLGEGIVDQIIYARGKQQFKDLMDFINRIDTGKVNRRKIDSLILAGAFDYTGATRAAMLKVTEEIVDFKKDNKAYESKLETYNKKIEAYKARITQIRLDEIKNGKSKLKPLKTPVKPEEPKYPIIRDVLELSEKEILKQEKELLGFYVSGHPVAKYKSLIDSEKNLSTIEDIKSFGSNGRNVSLIAVPCSINERTTKTSGKKMANFLLEDCTGSIPATAFPKTWEEYSIQLQAGEPLLIKARISITESAEESSQQAELLISSVNSLAHIKLSEDIIDLQIELNDDKIIAVQKLIEQFNGDETKIRLSFISADNTEFKISKLFSIRNRDLFVKQLAIIS
jgi:DNA polymerase III alpha subunit